MLNQTTRKSLLIKVASLADAEAWQQFCRIYGVLIQATARRAGLQQADCDDVTQAVFASMVSSMPNFVYDPKRGRFRAYLKSATLHEIARCRRRARDHRCVQGSEHVANGANDVDLALTWESEWRQHHIRRALKRAESEFSYQDMEAFRRYAVQAAPPQQVAQDMGMTIHQVYKSKSRVLQRLSEITREQIALES